MLEGCLPHVTDGVGKEPHQRRANGAGRAVVVAVVVVLLLVVSASVLAARVAACELDDGGGEGGQVEVRECGHASGETRAVPAQLRLALGWMKWRERRPKPARRDGEGAAGTSRTLHLGGLSGGALGGGIERSQALAGCVVRLGLVNGKVRVSHAPAKEARQAGRRRRLQETWRA